MGKTNGGCSVLRCRDQEAVSFGSSHALGGQALCRRHFNEHLERDEAAARERLLLEGRLPLRKRGGA